MFVPKAPQRRRNTTAEPQPDLLAGPAQRNARALKPKQERERAPPPPVQVAFQAVARTGTGVRRTQALSAAEMQAARAAQHGGIRDRRNEDGTYDFTDADLVNDDGDAGAALGPVTLPFPAPAGQEAYYEGWTGADPPGLPAYRDHALPIVVEELKQLTLQAQERADAAAVSGAGVGAGAGVGVDSGARVKTEPGTESSIAAGAGAGAGARIPGVADPDALLSFQDPLPWFAGKPVVPAAAPAVAGAAAGAGPGAGAGAGVKAELSPSGAGAGASAGVEDEDGGAAAAAGPTVNRGELILVQLPSGLPIYPPSVEAARYAAGTGAAAAAAAAAAAGAGAGAVAPAGISLASHNVGSGINAVPNPSAASGAGAGSGASASANAGGGAGDEWDHSLAHDVPMVVDDTTVKANQTAATLSKDFKIFSVQSESNIKNIPAGAIGEIVVFKSGKTKLKLGDTYFNLSAGVAQGAIEELVSISGNANGTNDLHKLGRIDKHLVCSLDVEHLLTRARNE
jgi:hypothetical protein